jgi:hypothetical protein
MFEGLERSLFSKDWITGILLLVLILITISKFYYNERFTKLFSLLYSEKYYTDFLKTKPFLFNLFHFFLFLVLILNLSLLVYFSFETFKPDKYILDYSFYIQILIAVLFYFLARYIIGYILGNLFDVSESQRHFTFMKISNLSMISIVYFPLLVLISYSTIALRKFLISFSLIFILILLFSRYYVMLKNERLNFNKLFYLILYLCALEIAPFIVIYKMFVA